MSLINDALKKVEEQMSEPGGSGGSGSPNTPTPNDPFEGNKKLFFILLGSGTLLIALVILLWTTLSSPSSKPKMVQEQMPIEELMAAEMPEDIMPATNSVTIASEEAPEEEPEAPAEEPTIEPRDNYSLESLAAKYDEPEETVESKERDLNQEMFESFVSVASRIITKKSGDEEEVPEEEEKSTISPIKTAQENMDAINRDADNQKAMKADRVMTREEMVGEYVESLNITGVMFSEKGNKILLNNQVFTINTSVSGKYQLTITEIQPHSVVFTDESGKQYTKEF